MVEGKIKKDVTDAQRDTHRGDEIVTCSLRNNVLNPNLNTSANYSKRRNI